MNDNDEEQLSLAKRIENPAAAKALALPLLHSAIGKADRHLEGRVLSFLAELDNLLEDYVAAYEQGNRAAHLLQSVGDEAEEAGALAVLAVASSCLGRNDQAIEAALLGVALAKRSQDVERLADAHVQLGHVLSHAKCFDAAKQSLRDARSLGDSDASALTMLCALVVEGSCEVTRVVTERHETGRMPSLTDIRSLLIQYEEFAASHDMEALAEPDQRPLLWNWWLVSSAAHCWLGEIERAEAELEAFRKCAKENGIAPWLESLEALVRCELAQARDDWPLAELQAQRMVALANESGREQAALLGLVLVSGVLERKGKHEEALTALKQLAARERRIRSETLPSRNAVVTWQLKMRRSEQMRRELQTSAEHFERLTLEDPLTGIANRRCFEKAVEESLRESRSNGRPLCAALIDVDQFKQVNDTHGHLVGDKVLQVIAALLTQHVREDDLAARLAGDEFVLLLRRNDLAHATEVCDRLRAAIASHEWDAIASGLAVTISLGVAQSRAEDSLQELLARSDSAMYELKSAARSGTA